MNSKDINILLATHLSVMPNVFKIAYENAPPVTDDYFLTVADMPIDVELLDFCNSEDKTGIFQVDVYGLRDNGYSIVTEQADAIANHFKYKTLGNELIITRAVIESAIITDAHYRKPISIYYRNIT